jgi:hypothetical protein
MEGGYVGHGWFELHLFGYPAHDVLHAPAAAVVGVPDSEVCPGLPLLEIRLTSCNRVTL